LAFLTEFHETSGQSSLESLKPRRMGCHIREWRGSNLGQGADYRDWGCRGLPQSLGWSYGEVPYNSSW